MSVTVRERPKRNADIDLRGPTASREYTVSGTTDLSVATLALSAVLPRHIDVPDPQDDTATIRLYRNRISPNELGSGNWEFRVAFAGLMSQVDVNFNNGVQSAKIFQAMDTIRQYDLIDGGQANGGGDFGNNVPNFHGAIGVDGDKVEGVEVEVSKVEFSVTQKYNFNDDNPLDPLYFINLWTLAAGVNGRTPVNDKPWSFNWMGIDIEFAKGNVRFRTFSTKRNDFNEVEITYQFAYERPIFLEDNFTLGESDPIVKEEGWWYLNVFYKQGVSNGQAMQVPACATIFQVYPYGNFDIIDL